MSWTSPQIDLSKILDEGDRSKCQLFNQLLEGYEQAFRRELRFQADVPIAYPQIMTEWLLAMHQRTRFIAVGIVDSINSNNEVLGGLGARALIESVSIVAYASDTLRRHYDGEMTANEMSLSAVRLRFGTRDFDTIEYTEQERELIQAVNVLTMLKRADKIIAKENPDGRKDLLGVWYKLLSELAHPNCQGTSVALELSMAAKVAVYEWAPPMRPGILGIICEAVFFSQYHFFDLSNKIFQDLTDHDEALPELIPTGVPIVDLR